MRQELSSNEEIKAFVRKTWPQVQFPLFAKCDVNGPDAHEVFKFLRRTTPELQETKGGGTKEIPWNFTKFLLNDKGKVVAYSSPRDDPIKLRPLIEKVLGLGPAPMNKV